MGAVALLQSDENRRFLHARLLGAEHAGAGVAETIKAIERMRTPQAVWNGRSAKLDETKLTAAYPKVGLDAAGQRRLDALLAAQDDPAGFERLLREIAGSGEYDAVVILTHAMFELPWVEAQRPRGRADTRMPKLRVETVLDAMVAVPEHDQLSAGYFRSLDGRGEVEAAKAKLLDWTVGHRDALVLDETRFVPKE